MIKNHLKLHLIKEPEKEYQENEENKEEEKKEEENKEEEKKEEEKLIILEKERYLKIK